MAEITPFSIMIIITSYATMMVEGWKAQRLMDRCQKVNAYEDKWQQDEVELEDLQKILCEKAHWEMSDGGGYKESDIKTKKGGYSYAWDKAWMGPQNRMNQTATRYQVFFYNTLIDDGYGEKRLTRIAEYLDEMLSIYRYDKTIIKKWEKELLDQAGFVVENPKDPRTGKHSASIML